MARLLAANAAVQRKVTLPEPGMTANSPTVDGKAMPVHPWDPAGPAISVRHSVAHRLARTEETFYDRPTPENARARRGRAAARARKRLGGDADARDRGVPQARIRTRRRGTCGF